MDRRLAAKGRRHRGGSCSLYRSASTSASEPADYDPIPSSSRGRRIECLSLLMKLHSPSCREFHLMALTCFLARGCKTAALFRWRHFEDLIIRFAYTSIVAVADVLQCLRTVMVTGTHWKG